jgi:hypothetical protein
MLKTMKIKKLQTEVTYEVLYEGVEYTVTSVENLDEGYLDWTVFDENLDDLAETNEKLNDSIIEAVMVNG